MIQVLIGGQDYTPYVDLPTLRIAANVAVNNDTATFDVKISAQAIPRPKGGQEIKIINGSVTEFGGVLVDPKETALATDQMLYQCQCRDYTFWLDKRLVTNTYTNYTYGNIVKDIVANFTTGFTSDNVSGTEASFTVPSKKYDHKPPSESIKNLADEIAFQFWVDYSKDVHFGQTVNMPSPLPNNLLLPDTDTVNYSNLEFDEDVSQVRNQIYLMGYKVPATYTIPQNFQADGQNNTYTLGYEPKHTLSTIVVKVGTTTYPTVLDIVTGQPNNQVNDGKAYINYKNRTVRFNVAPASGSIVSITYYPMFETLKMYNDPNAMAEMKSRDGQDGVYEFAIRDPQLTTVDSTLADVRGQLELYKYAYPHYTGQFISFTPGWQPGQYFYITSVKRMDGIFQETMFYVIKVDKEIIRTDDDDHKFRYTVSISDTPYSY